MKRIYVIALLVFAISFGSCSTKSQLVGTWAESSLGESWGIEGASPYDNPWAKIWEFRSDNTFKMGDIGGMYSGQGKYTVLDNGSIKIEFQGGRTITGNIENKKLIINWGNEQTVLKKYR